MKIPKAMSTQHPDNVKNPFFVSNSVIAGDDEIKEAFYAYSHLKIKEQLWDCEGKEVDNFVVEKLLTRYPDYFERKKLGKDINITLRCPNPRVEKNQGKLLLETLESIPRNFDIASKFYSEDVAPIFEVSIPMVSSAEEVLRVRDYYEKYVVGKNEKIVNDIELRTWVGDFNPKEINVIPLIEDKDSMLNAAEIAGKYLENVKTDYQRVWLARSDPALNYGNLSAILVNKVALQRLYKLEDDISVDIRPIIGCGSVPFRGHLTPGNMKQIIKAYPSVHTHTLQSAFKYDYPENEVRDAVELLESTETKRPVVVDEESSLEIIEKVSFNYRKQVAQIAPLINKLSSYIPKRRKRKLHIGLFGYSREQDKISLPRAITFCASLYSIGLPPEIFGLSDITAKELDYVEDVTASFNDDMSAALQYYNEDSLSLIPKKLAEEVKNTVKRFDYETDNDHKKVTSFAINDFKKNNPEALIENVERAASIRNFLG